MNKYFLIFILVAISTFGQRKQFETALKNGRNTSGFYWATVASDKAIKETDVLEYAAKNNYLLRNLTYQMVNRFGDKFKGVKSFDFLPINEIPQVIYETKFNSGISFKEITSKNRGKVYFWRGSEMFTRYSNFHWSGNLNAEGLVNGDGFGYFYNEEKKLSVFFKGNFINGVLQGSGTFGSYSYSDNSNFDSGSLVKLSVHLSNIYNDDMAVLTVDGKKGFVSKDMKDGFYPKYRTVIQEFSNGKAIVLNDDNKEIVINKTGGFLAKTEKQIQIDEAARIRKAEQDRLQQIANEKARIQREKEAEESRIANEIKRREAEENRLIAIESRKNQINSIGQGDVVCFSEDWNRSEWFGLFNTKYNMKATMIVDNVTSSGRLILIVNNVKSSKEYEYSSMKYGNLEIKEDQKISVTKNDMIYDNRFQFCN